MEVTRYRAHTILLSWGLLLVGACGCAPAELADSSLEPTSEAAAGLEEGFYKVPEDATAEELVEYIDRMRAFRPATSNRAELNEHRRRSSLAIIEAAERLLEMKPDALLEEQAQMRRFEALFMLAKYGDQKSADRLLELAGELRNHPSATVADMAVLYTLTRAVERLTHGDLPAEERQRLVDETAAELSSESFDPRMAELAVELTRALERAGDRQLAMSGGERFSAILSTHPEFADQFDALQGALRRLKLLGRKLPLHGFLPSGQALDTTKLEGKVVLIDFWATWCGPCVEELSRLRGLYEMYQPLGFEILGVSLDEDRDVLRSFLAERKLPWPVICGRTAEESGFQHPLAVECGVYELPTTLLLDRGGVVVAVDVYGEDIERRLHGLLSAAVPAPAAEAANAQPDQDARPAPAGQADADGQPETNRQPSSVDSQPAAHEGGEGDTGASRIEPLAAPDESQAASEIENGERAAAGVVEGGAGQAAADGDESPPDTPGNPYLAPKRYTPQELAAYLEKALAKPRRVQERPGFLEAVVDAADRILAADAPEELKLAALLARFRALHALADSGNASAAESLAKMVDAYAGDLRPQVAAEVRLHLLARRAAQADSLPPDQLPSLLEELKAYFAETELEYRHLSLASATVHVINLLPDAAAAARWYREFGELFAASEDQVMSRYGKKLARSKAARSRVGQTMELEGTPVDGRAFSWQAFRGKVVLVDFWATWCGPCRDELPNVKQNYERWRDRGFEVVGISLDEEREQLLAFVKAEGIPWVNLIGEGDAVGWNHPMAVKYEVRAIPHTFLIDREGKIVAEGVRGEQLGEWLQRLLGEQAEP